MCLKGKEVSTDPITNLINVLQKIEDRSRYMYGFLVIGAMTID